MSDNVCFQGPGGLCKPEFCHHLQHRARRSHNTLPVGDSLTDWLCSSTLVCFRTCCCLHFLMVWEYLYIFTDQNRWNIIMFVLIYWYFSSFCVLKPIITVVLMCELCFCVAYYHSKWCIHVYTMFLCSPQWMVYSCASCVFV